MWLALFTVFSVWATSRHEVTVIGKVGNFDSNLVTIVTETGPALVPRSAVIDQNEIQPGKIVRAVLTTEKLEKLNAEDDAFFSKPPAPPAPRPRRPMPH